VENELEEIEVVESSGGVDKKLYEGYRTKIEKIEALYVKDLFPDGDTYTPDSTTMKHVLRITTESLKILVANDTINPTITENDWEYPNDNGSTDKVRIYADLSFGSKRLESTNEIIKENQKVVLVSGEHGEERITKEAIAPVKVISKAPRAKLWKFMRKHQVEDYRDLVGVPVILTVQPSKKDNDKFFINIVLD